MKQPRCIILIVLFTTVHVSLWGQEADSTSRINHGFGLNADIISGLGFSYMLSSQKLSFQMSFLPVHTRKQKRIFFQGLSLEYVIKNKNEHRLFSYLGGTFIAEFHSYEANVWAGLVNGSPTWENLTVHKKSFLLRTGGGIGLNLKATDYFYWVFRMGYSYNWDFIKRRDIFPSVGLGVYYKL